MSLELVVIVAAVAVVGLVGLTIGFRAGSARRASRGEAVGPPGPLESAADAVDRSIGMYAVRRLTGRPTEPPEDIATSTGNLTADEVAHRIGVPDAPAPPPPEIPSPAVAGAAATAAAARGTTDGRVAPEAAVSPDALTARRERLVRDAGFALIALAALGLVAFLALPNGFGGKPSATRFAVTRVSSRPVTSPSAVVPTTAPSVAAATAGPVVGPAEAFFAQTVGESTMRARITWSGSDPGSTGVARYQLQLSINGGAFATMSLATSTSTSFDRTLSDEFGYRFRVRATNREGNMSAYVNGPTFTPGRIQDTSPNVVYAGSWTTTTTSSALGGSYRYASSLSARASLTRTVRDFAWVATKTSAGGSAQVWIDGVLAATVNLHSTSTSYRQLVFQRHFPTLGSHTIQIRPIGGGRIYLDAFLIYR